MKKTFKRVALSGVLRDKKNGEFLKAILNTLKDLEIEILCEQKLVNNAEFLKENSFFNSSLNS